MTRADSRNLLNLSAQNLLLLLLLLLLLPLPRPILLPDLDAIASTAFLLDMIAAKLFPSGETPSFFIISKTFFAA